MAERGAHLSQLLTDSSRPSIFEVVAQEGLNQALRGVVKFCVRVCANHYPDTFGTTFRWANEIQLLFDITLQNYYLQKYGASFSENFYGMERIMKNDSPLHKKGKFFSLFSLTVLPYMLSKLDEYLSERQQPVPRQTFLSFSSIRFLYDGIVLVNWMLYTWGKTVTHSPILHMLGIKLSHGNSENDSALSLTKIIELSAFLIQFLQWWFTNPTSQAKSILSLPIPPPPHSKVTGAQYNTKPGVCPICEQKLKNECVLRVSGYVYCYRCITYYLRENNNCPISKLPATSNDLIRIFANV